MAARKRSPRKSARKKASTGDRSPKHISFPCTTFEQADHTLVLFSASAKTLYSLCTINQRLEDKDEGYQRALSPARAKRIASFIDDGNLLPTSVLVSLDEDTSLTESSSCLKVPNRPDAGWVIDGQHRLAGAHRSRNDVIIPVVAFIGLSLDEQIACFVTINKEQKGVPASLYLDLLKHLPPRKSEAEITRERAADLGQAMKIDEGSPFYARIVVTTSPKQGEISLTNFVRKLAPLIKRDGRLSTFRDEERQLILDNYYRGLEQVFPSEFRKVNSIFFKTLGFGALVGLLPTFIDVTLSRSGGGFTAKDATDTFKLISHVDFSTWHERGTGTQAENAATDDLRTELLESADSGSGTIRLR